MNKLAIVSAATLRGGDRRSCPPPPPLPPTTTTHYQPPPPAVSTQELPLCVACCETQAVGLMADDAGASAVRRRQRRLRAMLRHERRGGSVAFLDPPFLAVAAHVVDNGSGLFLAGFHPFYLAGPVSWHFRHHVRFGPDGHLRGEMSRSS